MRTNENLIEVKPYRSLDNDRWYFKLTYEYTDKKGKHVVIYPKVSLPFSQGRAPYPNSPWTGVDYFECDDRMNVYKGTSALAASKGCTDEAYLFDIITEPAEPKEMTLEEIEKKLGYKVKVVSKED